LQTASSKKLQKAANTVDRHAFFLHALPPEVDSLTLAELHQIVRDVWLTRHEPEITTEQLARRKGRPPSTREVNLVKLKESESEEYRTGLEVLDLTSSTNVELLRRWKQDDASYLDILRFIRISRDHPHEIVVSRPGKHRNFELTIDGRNNMDGLQFSSTIQGMDEIA